MFRTFRTQAYCWSGAQIEDSLDERVEDGGVGQTSGVHALAIRESPGLVDPAVGASSNKGENHRVDGRVEQGGECVGSDD